MCDNGAGGGDEERRVRCRPARAGHRAQQYSPLFAVHLCAQALYVLLGREVIAQHRF